MNTSFLQIGELARRSGVSVDTVRYYEKLELLPQANRSSGGFRIFSEEVAERIRFIKDAQEMGFSLQEIKQLFLIDEGKNQCLAVKELLLSKLSELEVKMEQMKSFKTTLKNHLVKCEKELRSHGDESACPVLIPIERSR